MSVKLSPDTRRVFTRSFLVVFAALVAINGATLAPSPAWADEPTPTPAPAVAPIDIIPNFNLMGVLGTVVPSEIILDGTFHANALASALFDLVQYMKNNVDHRSRNDQMATIPKYNRLQMFGSWVNENSPSDCYNTRAEALLRDAVPGSKIGFSAGNPCQVAKGEWHDPYAGADYKLAGAVQIDHVVPLKNAYRSGAHAWSRERRCHYANFLVDPKHLLAVSGHENMAKGDSGPEGYLPPDPTYVCEYVANWMRIKAVWNLTFSVDEENAVQVALQSNNCTVASTRLKLPELQQTRARSLTLNSKCTP
ncbi:hypothetical protein BH10BDE1_BH10BDE1_15290 [soil metagenome]